MEYVERYWKVFFSKCGDLQYEHFIPLKYYSFIFKNMYFVIISTTYWIYSRGEDDLACSHGGKRTS